MWSAIRWLVLRFAALRWLFKLGGLGLLLPIALLLKTIGLPLLAIGAGPPGSYQQCWTTCRTYPACPRH